MMSGGRGHPCRFMVQPSRPKKRNRTMSAMWRLAMNAPRNMITSSTGASSWARMVAMRARWLVNRKQVPVPMMLARARLQEMVKMTSRCWSSISGPGGEPLDLHGAQEQRHAGAAGDAEGQGGDQAAAVLGVVGALGRDDAAHVALAEVVGVLLGVQGVAVGEPVHHQRAQARNDADPYPDRGGADHQPPVSERVPDPFPPALESAQGARVDALSRDQ